MKSYSSLKIVATFYQVIAYVILLSGLLSMVGLSSFFLNYPNGIAVGIGLMLVVIIAFVGVLAISQSIMLMVNVADDVEDMRGNIHIVAQNSEQQRTHYEMKNLENQQKIIDLLSKDKSEKTSTQTKTIDTNDL